MGGRVGLFPSQRMICLNQCGADGHEEKWDKNEKHERRNHLDSGFRSLFFGALAAGGSQRIRVNAQSLGDAGAKTIGLDQSADERTNVIDPGTVDEIAQRFHARFTGPHFKIDQMKFVAEIGMGMVQVLADAEERLIERQAGLHADYG